MPPSSVRSTDWGKQIVTFDGRVDAPTYWVRCNTVQEGSTGFWDGGYGAGGITGWADQDLQDVTLSPEIVARFTTFSTFPGENHFRDDDGYLIARAKDCTFYGGGVGGYVIGCYFTNCLMERLNAGQVWAFPGNEIHFRNCTWIGGRFDLDRYHTAIPVTINDCVFEGTIFNATDAYASNATYTVYDYNAFTNATTQTSPPGANDLVIANFNWQTGWLGKYYLPTNSGVVDSGSLTNAGLAGLYHYTTATNQVKEAGSRLDRGYHYVAASLVNGQVEPIDSNGDGIPDYLADKNGNGLFDTGETDWRPNAGTTNSLGLIIFTPLR